MIEMQTSTARVLSIGSDEMLLSIREMLLNQAGYEVCSLSERSVSVQMVIASFDLLLLCHSIPVTRAESIGAWLKSRFPHIAVVRLASLHADRQPSFDVVCNVHHGPVRLLQELDSIRRQSYVAASVKGSLQGQQI